MTLNSKEGKALMDDFLSRKKNNIGKCIYIAQLYYKLNKQSPGLDRKLFKQVFKEMAILGLGTFIGSNKFRPVKPLKEIAEESLGKTPEVVVKPTDDVVRPGFKFRVGKFTMEVIGTDNMGCPIIKLHA